MHAAGRAVHGRTRVQQSRRIFVSPLRRASDYARSVQAGVGRMASGAVSTMVRSLVLLSTVLVLLPASSVRGQRGGSRSVNWPLHNLDLAGTRFSALDQINTANVRN